MDLASEATLIRRNQEAGQVPQSAHRRQRRSIFIGNRLEDIEGRTLQRRAGGFLERGDEVSDVLLHLRPGGVFQVCLEAI